MARVNKIFWMILVGCLTVTVPAAAEDTTGLWNAGKAYYQAGSYQASLRNGLEAVDQVYQKQVQKMFTLVPDLGGFTTIETNFNYTFSDQNGIMDYSLQVQKAMTNTNGGVRITVDTSLNNLERYVNLIRSFDFLTDKGNYKKLLIKIRKSEWTNITENGDAYIIPVLNEVNDTIVSGVLFKVSFNYSAFLRASEKDRITESVVRELLEKINIREMVNLVK